MKPPPVTSLDCQWITSVTGVPSSSPMMSKNVCGDERWYGSSLERIIGPGIETSGLASADSEKSMILCISSE